MFECWRILFCALWRVLRLVRVLEVRQLIAFALTNGLRKQNNTQRNVI